MNAKELLKDVARVTAFANGTIERGGLYGACHRIRDHILATVRDDDDEAVTVEWCAGVGVQDTDLVEVLKDRLRNEWYKTRGDVRRLCSALGIELREPQQ